MGANRRGAGHRRVAPLRPPSFSVSVAAQRSGEGRPVVPVQSTHSLQIHIAPMPSSSACNLMLVYDAAELPQASKTNQTSCSGRLLTFEWPRFFIAMQKKKKEIPPNPPRLTIQTARQEQSAKFLGRAGGCYGVYVRIQNKITTLSAHPADH